MPIRKSHILIMLVSVTQLAFSIYILREIKQFENASRSGATHIYFLDVGQGDASYIVAPNNNSLLIDSGPPNKKVLIELSSIKPLILKNIETALGTHPDMDHVGSFNDVKNKYPISSYIYNGVGGGNITYQNFLKNISASSSNTTPIIGLNGVTIWLDKNAGVSFKIISPNFDDLLENYYECESSKKPSAKTAKEGTNKNKNKKPKKVRATKCEKFLHLTSNEGSIVGILTYKKDGITKKVLYTGDAPISIEDNLIRRAREDSDFAKLLDIDILKVGHHGSKTSTSEDFLRLTTPTTAIISVGKNNRYGHPNNDVIERLLKYLPKERVLRTDELGTVSI